MLFMQKTFWRSEISKLVPLPSFSRGGNDPLYSDHLFLKYILKYIFKYSLKRIDCAVNSYFNPSYLENSYD